MKMSPGKYEKTIYDDMQPMSDSQGKGTELDEGRIERNFKRPLENADSDDPGDPPGGGGGEGGGGNSNGSSSGGSSIDGTVGGTSQKVSDILNGDGSDGGSGSSSDYSGDQNMSTKQSLENQFNHCKSICSDIDKWKTNNIKTTSALDAGLNDLASSGGLREAAEKFSRYNMQYQNEVGACLKLLDKQQKAFLVLSKRLNESINNVKSS